MTVYTLAATVRTCSSTLCDQLRANRIGKPLEHYSSMDLGTPIETVNGYTGTNIMSGQMNVAYDHLKNTERWIYLYRDDLVKQAVSWLIAVQSGDFSYRENNLNRQPIVFDFPVLHSYVARLNSANQRWENFFAARRIEPFRISTEAFLADRGAMFSAICDYLEVPFSIDQTVGHERVKQEMPEKKLWVDYYYECLKGSRARAPSNFNYKDVSYHYESVIEAA